MSLYETLLVTSAFFGVVTVFALISHLFDEGSRLLFFGALILFAVFGYWTRTAKNGNFSFEDLNVALTHLVRNVLGFTP